MEKYMVDEMKVINNKYLAVLDHLKTKEIFDEELREKLMDLRQSHTNVIVALDTANGTIKQIHDIVKDFE